MYKVRLLDNCYDAVDLDYGLDERPQEPGTVVYRKGSDRDAPTWTMLTNDPTGEWPDHDQGDTLWCLSFKPSEFEELD